MSDSPTLMSTQHPLKGLFCKEGSGYPVSQPPLLSRFKALKKLGKLALPFGFGEKLVMVAVRT